MALSDVYTVICATNAELEPSFQMRLFSEQWHSPVQRQDSSFVRYYSLSHSAQKPSYEGWQCAVHCTSTEQLMWYCNTRQKWLLKTKKQREDSRWHARSQHTTIQGWSFPTCNREEIFVERIEGL